jgi:hypothetical protein
MEPTSLLGIIPKVIGHLAKPFSWGVKKGHLLVHKLMNLKPPLDEIQASKVAFSIIGGNIVKAIAYKNIDSKHIFITGIRSESKSGYEKKVFLLEQIGKTYRKIWESDDLGYLADTDDVIEIADIENNGINELIIKTESWGTGFGTRELKVFSSASNKVSTITENYTYCIASAPLAPEIEIETDEEKGFKEKLEKFALEKGFLDANFVVDLDDPNFAEQKWHIENGDDEYDNKILNLFFYDYTDEELVDNSNSLVSELNTKDILWRGYFKGPLIGYLKSTKKWFVVYSPNDRYCWVENLIALGNCIWFSPRFEKGFFAFCFNEEDFIILSLIKTFQFPK